jgi:hypothetical protein
MISDNGKEVIIDRFSSVLANRASANLLPMFHTYPLARTEAETKAS